MNRMFLIGGGTLLVLVAVLASRGCGGGGTNEYQTATVSRGAITQAVTATGTLNPVSTYRSAARSPAISRSCFVDYNSPVKAGEVVAQLDPATFQASVLQAEGDVANAHAGLELARATFKRKEELVAQAARRRRTRYGAGHAHQAEGQREDQGRPIANERGSI